MKNTNKPNKPLIIYIAENDHGDMSYGSLAEQIIKDCHAKGLSTKTFAEFPSQSGKAQKQTTRPSAANLMTLDNSPESVEATAKFLDQEFIEIGNMRERYVRYEDTWKQLEQGIKGEQLIELREEYIDNPELLKLMKNDLTTGEISGKDKIGDLANFYAYWRSPMHYALTHERMVEDVRRNLESGNPDVMIISVGTPHIPGLDKQLTEFQNCQKIIVGQFPKGLNPYENYVYGGTPEACAKVGQLVDSFEVDLDKKEALVPEALKLAIDEIFQVNMANSKIKKDEKIHKDEGSKAYRWISIKTANDQPQNLPIIAFIASSNGLLGEEGQKNIKYRIKLLAKLGFEIKIPVFTTPDQQQEIVDVIELDNNGENDLFDKLQNVLVEPFKREASHGVSPEVGSNQIIQCIKNGWNIMPLMGGASFENKLALVQKYFQEYPNEKNPEVKIFGYSNASWANVLALEDICSYVPTQYTNHFLRTDALAKLKDEVHKSGGVASEDQSNLMKYFEYFEQQVESLQIVMKGGIPETFSRQLLFSPPETPTKRAGRTIHYPLNADVLTGICNEPNRLSFKPKADKDWSFAIEWMMQTGANPAKFSNTPSLIDKFLEANKDHPTKFIEIGCLGTRFDGFDGIADLIHDDKTGLRVIDERNVARILSQKPALTKRLNEFLQGYRELQDNNESDVSHKIKHGKLPEFLEAKLQKNGFIDEKEIDQKTVEQILDWQNEAQERVVNDVLAIAEKYNIPLVLNSRFGHVANMSPIQSGLCHYSIADGSLHLESDLKKEQYNTSLKQEIDALDLQHPKKPSPNPEKSHLEKMVGTSKGEANEI